MIFEKHVIGEQTGEAYFALHDMMKDFDEGTSYADWRFTVVFQGVLQDFFGFLGQFFALSFFATFSEPYGLEPATFSHI